MDKEAQTWMSAILKQQTQFINKIIAFLEKYKQQIKKNYE